MSDPFTGQIMMMAFDFAPKHWALCDGGLLPVAQNAALFSLLGNQFGGDGRTSFALPDLRGRTPVGGIASADPAWAPPPYGIGQKAGSEEVTLTLNQMPQHTHSFAASDTAAQTGAVPTQQGGFATASLAVYSEGPPDVVLGGSPLSVTGGQQPHANLQPFAVIGMSICLQGYYPPRP